MNVVGSRPVLKPIISRLRFNGSGLVVAASKYFEGTASLMVLNFTVCACAAAAGSSMATAETSTRDLLRSEADCVIISLSFRWRRLRRRARSRTDATKGDRLKCLNGQA